MRKRISSERSAVAVLRKVRRDSTWHAIRDMCRIESLALSTRHWRILNRGILASAWIFVLYISKHRLVLIDLCIEGVCLKEWV